MMPFVASMLMGAVPGAIAPPSNNAVYAAAYDTNSDWLLYNKSATTVLTTDHAASIVKLLTALVVLDYKSATLASDTGTVTSADLTRPGVIVTLQNNDVMTLSDLMKTMLIHSDNGAAQCLARTVGDYIFSLTGTGSSGVTRFVAAMNARAAALGLTNTTVTQPDYGWTTTALDIAKLAKVAWQSSTIRTGTSTVTTTVSVTGANARTITLRAIAPLINGPINDPGRGITYPGILADKNGILSSTYYGNAALWQAPDGIEVVLVALDAPSAYEAALAIIAMIETLAADFPYLANDWFVSGHLLLSGDAQSGTDKLL